MFDRILHIEAQFGISFHPAQGKCRGYLSLNAKTDMISSSAGGVLRAVEASNALRRT